MVTKTEAELDAMSTEELRLLAIQEGQEQEAAEKAAAEKAAADQAAREAEAAKAAELVEKELTEHQETPEEIAAREAAEAAEAEKAAALAKEAAERAAQQERDEQGRFKKKDDTVVEDNGEPDEWVFRREVPRSNGSVQVYEGRGATEVEALQDLNDKLVKAQENATREVENIQKKHPKEPEPSPTPEISEDQEYVFKQQFEKKPSEAFKAMFKELTGMDVTEFKTWQAAQKAAEEARTVQAQSLQTQRDWVATHPEYIISEENGNQMRDWVQSHNYNEFTQENLEKAFEDLSERGLLKLKTDEASAPTTTEVPTKVNEPARIEQPATVSVTEVTPVRSPKKASSVSTTRSPAPVVKTEPTEDELYDMSPEEFAKLGKNFPRSAK